MRVRLFVMTYASFRFVQSPEESQGVFSIIFYPRWQLVVKVSARPGGYAKTFANMFFVNSDAVSVRILNLKNSGLLPKNCFDQICVSFNKTLITGIPYYSQTITAGEFAYMAIPQDNAYEFRQVSILFKMVIRGFDFPFRFLPIPPNFKVIYTLPTHSLGSFSKRYVSFFC